MTRWIVVHYERVNVEEFGSYEKIDLPGIPTEAEIVTAPTAEEALGAVARREADEVVYLSALPVAAASARRYVTTVEEEGSS